MPSTVIIFEEINDPEKEQWRSFHSRYPRGNREALKCIKARCSFRALSNQIASSAAIQVRPVLGRAEAEAEASDVPPLSTLTLVSAAVLAPPLVSSILRSENPHGLDELPRAKRARRFLSRPMGREDAAEARRAAASAASTTGAGIGAVEAQVIGMLAPDEVILGWNGKPSVLAAAGMKAAAELAAVRKFADERHSVASMAMVVFLSDGQRGDVGSNGIWHLPPEAEEEHV